MAGYPAEWRVPFYESQNPRSGQWEQYPADVSARIHDALQRANKALVHTSNGINYYVKQEGPDLVQVRSDYEFQPKEKGGRRPVRQTDRAIPSLVAPSPAVCPPAPAADDEPVEVVEDLDANTLFKVKIEGGKVKAVTPAEGFPLKRILDARDKAMPVHGIIAAGLTIEDPAELENYEWVLSKNDCLFFAPITECLVDNTELKVTNPGLPYHLSKRVMPIKGVFPRDWYAPWGTIVRGVLIGSKWLRVGGRYLPMCVGPVRVLRPQVLYESQNPKDKEWVQYDKSVSAKIHDALQNSQKALVRETKHAVQGSKGMEEVTIRYFVKREGRELVQVRSDYEHQPKESGGRRPVRKVEAVAQVAPKVEAFDCPICAEEKPVEGSFTGTCDDACRVCMTCIFDHISGKIDENKTNPDQLRCVLCPKPISPEHIEFVLRIHGRHDLEENYLKQRQEAEIKVAGSFRTCPQCKVVSWVERPDGPGFRAVCRECNHPFCSRCAAPRYHFFRKCELQEDCAQLMRQKEAAWLQWRAEGKALYLAKVAALDAQYAQLLDKFEADDADQKQKAAAYAAFQADEQSKAQMGWVHCPYCHALWAGSDACPSVTCGILEAAMGQKRAAAVGCGKKFNLKKQGIPYTPAVAPPPPPAVQQPKKPEGVLHNVPCNQCGQPIKGVRYRCLHCPEYNLCVMCEARHGSEHDAEKDFPGREKPHVFEVLHEPVSPDQTALRLWFPPK